MFLSTLISVLAVGAPALVHATGTLGFALGTKNADGSCKYTADYEADFDALSSASGTKIVRGYDANDCNCAQQILPAAQNKGFQVILGIWPDVSTSFNDGINAIQTYMPGYEDQVYAITVGSESLYRGTFTGSQLLSKINQVKQIFPNALVGTADSWNKYADGTADAIIQGGVDLLLVNAFGYWQGQAIRNASHTFFDDINQAFSHIQSFNNGITLWVGETGWPTTGGSNYGNAIASTAFAKRFWKHGVCAMLDWGVNVFYFEAFDEPWKPTSIGDTGNVADETHWGACTASRQPKFALTC